MSKVQRTPEEKVKLYKLTDQNGWTRPLHNNPWERRIKGNGGS